MPAAEQVGGGGGGAETVPGEEQSPSPAECSAHQLVAMEMTTVIKGIEG